jgi:MATE family multidrug resistance protein
MLSPHVSLDETAAGWWAGPAGMREILRVAMPLMISAGCFTLTLFVDRTLLLFHSEASMAASLSGGNFFWLMACLPIGAASMTGAFIAQAIGSARPRSVGVILGHAALLSAATLPLYLLLIPMTRSILEWAQHPPELVAAEAIYIRILLLGATGAILEASLAGFFSGTERTGVVMAVNIAATVVNLVLDCLLIFGWLGLPAMGIAGAAWATTISFWFKAVVFSVLIARPVDRAFYGITRPGRLQLDLVRRLLFFGIPAGVHYLAESAAFAVIVLQVGALGAAPLASMTMAINFNMLAFVPLLGVSAATSVLVGQHLTRGGPALAVRATLGALSIALIYSGLWMAVYLLFPQQLLSLYDSSPWHGRATDPDLLSTAAILLRFVAVYCLFDATQIVLAGALRGAGDTWFVLMSFSVITVLVVVVGYTGQSWLGGSLYWWWTVMTGWVVVLAATMSARFLSGAWQTKRLLGDSQELAAQTNPVM